MNGPLFRSRVPIAIGASAVAFTAIVAAAARSGGRDKLALLPATVSQFASQANDPTPTSATFVESTRQKANRVLFHGTRIAEADRPVYVVSLSGNFTVSAPHPSGHANPSGRFLTLLYDAETLEPLDFGVLFAPSDLAQLGEPKTLILR